VRFYEPFAWTLWHRMLSARRCQKPLRRFALHSVLLDRGMR